MRTTQAIIGMHRIRWLKERESERERDVKRNGNKSKLQFNPNCKITSQIDFGLLEGDATSNYHTSNFK